jgi:nucleotide-binding universal stress UspA family protein
MIGPIARSIVEFAQSRDADLIVMSTHALTGPARTVLGSVADEEVRAADRPVLLGRQSDENSASADNA